MTTKTTHYRGRTAAATRCGIPTDPAMRRRRVATTTDPRLVTCAYCTAFAAVAK